MSADELHVTRRLLLGHCGRVSLEKEELETEKSFFLSFAKRGEDADVAVMPPLMLSSSSSLKSFCSTHSNDALIYKSSTSPCLHPFFCRCPLFLFTSPPDS